MLMHGPRTVAVANPRTLEFRARTVWLLAGVRVRVVVNALVLTLAAQGPRAFRHNVEEALARTPVLTALPALEG